MEKFNKWIVVVDLNNPDELKVWKVYGEILPKNYVCDAPDDGIEIEKLLEEQASKVRKQDLILAHSKKEKKEKGAK